MSNRDPRSFWAKLADVWTSLRFARQLRKSGISDPGEVRRRVVERLLERRDSSPQNHHVVPDEISEFLADYDPFESHEEGPPSDRQIALIRKLRWAWNEVEAGAPMVSQAEPYGGLNPLSVIEQELQCDSTEAAAKAHADLAPMIAWFVQNATMMPGQYRLDSGTFRITDEHLVLLKELVFYWDGEAIEQGPWPTLVADPKRPYGMFTNHLIEMALKLNVVDDPHDELTLQERKRLDRLHRELLPAIRVVCQYGAVANQHLDSERMS